jgi:hypothetical protein
MDVTTQLGKLIEEVTVDGPPRRRAAVANTMKYLLQYKGKIQSLEKAMVSFQNTLNSGTLAHLWYASFSKSDCNEAKYCRYHIFIKIKKESQVANYAFSITRGIIYSVLM